MPNNLSDLAIQVNELQVALDAEQEQVIAAIAAKDEALAALQVVVDQKNAAIAALEASIADLEVLVAAGGTAEERQAVSDKLAAIKADLEATV